MRLGILQHGLDLLRRGWMSGGYVSARSARQPAIELLRCLLMLAIVFDHCCSHGFFGKTPEMAQLAALTFFAVPTYVFITGWFGVTFRPRRLVRLLACGLGVSLTLAALSPFVLGKVVFRYGLGWFGWTYLALLCFLPCVNRFVERHVRACWLVTTGVMLGIWGCGFDGLPHFLEQFLLMLFIYLTGREFSGCAFVTRAPGWAWGVLAAAAWGVLACWRPLLQGHAGAEAYVRRFAMYYAPFTVVAAAALFLCVRTWRIPDRLGRICAWMGPSMFAVYLLHDGTARKVLKPIYVGLEKWLTSGDGACSPAFACLLTAVAVFLFCLALDMPRRFAAAFLCRNVLRPVGSRAVPPAVERLAGDRPAGAETAARACGTKLQPELHLFVLWEKARRCEAKILADLAKEMTIVWTGEMSFTGDAAKSYEAFYGPCKKVDGVQKVKRCGGGRFRVVIVRDDAPRYGNCEAVPGDPTRLYVANLRMYALKNRYRDWTGRRHRVHSTTDRDEFRRDVVLLTGHTEDAWRSGIPEGIALNIPVAPDGNRPLAVSPRGVARLWRWLLDCLRRVGRA